MRRQGTLPWLEPPRPDGSNSVSPDNVLTRLCDTALAARGGWLHTALAKYQRILAKCPRGRVIAFLRGCIVPVHRSQGILGTVLSRVVLASIVTFSLQLCSRQAW